MASDVSSTGAAGPLGAPRRLLHGGIAAACSRTCAAGMLGLLVAGSGGRLRRLRPTLEEESVTQTPRAAAR